MMTTDNNDSQTKPLRTRVGFLVGAVVVGIGFLVLAANVVAGLVAPGDEGDRTAGIPVTVSVEPGSSASTIYELLDSSGVVAYRDIEAAAREAEAEARLQPGTYNLATGMDAGEVLRLLIEGGTAPDSRTITIVEGWTIARIVAELAEATEYNEDVFVDALVGGAVTSPLVDMAPSWVDPLMRWEGLLYPAKYAIPEGTAPTTMLQTMADEMVNRFESTDWSEIEDLGISRYEALVVGSLIEREAGTDEDRPLISSVIHNRLGIPMRLQIDATVIYALGTNPGVVTAADLETNSPYNTYRNDGLPPTPIGTVSTTSLTAALNPQDSDYLFYVLASSDGSHAFAVTYEEHQENVRTAKESGVLP
jgi:UPF0755 protein